MKNKPYFKSKINIILFSIMMLFLTAISVISIILIVEATEANIKQIEFRDDPLTMTLAIILTIFLFYVVFYLASLFIFIKNCKVVTYNTLKIVCDKEIINEVKAMSHNLPVEGKDEHGEPLFTYEDIDSGDEKVNNKLYAYCFKRTLINVSVFTFLLVASSLMILIFNLIAALVVIGLILVIYISFIINLFVVYPKMAYKKNKEYKSMGIRIYEDRVENFVYLDENKRIEFVRLCFFKVSSHKLYKDYLFIKSKNSSRVSGISVNIKLLERPAASFLLARTNLNQEAKKNEKHRRN